MTDGAEITVDGKQVGSTPLGEMVWTTPGRHQVAAQHAGFSPAIEDVVVRRRQGRRRQHELRPIDLRAREPDGRRMGRSWGPAAQPPPTARGAEARRSIAGPGSGSRRAWSSPRARRRDHYRDSGSGGGLQRRAGDDARRTEGVLMRAAGDCRCVLALLAVRGRACGGSGGGADGGPVDRRDPRDLRGGRSRAASDPRQRPPRQRRHGQRPVLPHHRRPGRSSPATRSRCSSPPRRMGSAGPHPLRAWTRAGPRSRAATARPPSPSASASTTRSRCRRCAGPVTRVA